MRIVWRKKAPLRGGLFLVRRNAPPMVGCRHYIKLPLLYLTFGRASDSQGADDA